MKTTKSQKTIEIIKEAKEVVDQIRLLQKKEKDLKDKIYEILKDDNTLVADNLVVLVCKVTRMQLDTNRLKAEKEDIYRQYLQEKSYKTMQIKAA